MTGIYDDGATHGPDSDAQTYWTCDPCGTENQPEDEHCQTCDTWRSEQESE